MIDRPGPLRFKTYVIQLSVLLCIGILHASAEDLVVRKEGKHCGEDPHCFNRIHSDVPMILRASPGQQIILETRNTLDIDLSPGADPDPRMNDVSGSTVHPVTGPIYIEGARAGDTLAITIHEVVQGDYGFTFVAPFGFISDHFPAGRTGINWKLNDDYAESDELPGVRIPHAAFPGIITTLPDKELNGVMFERERVLIEAGGAVSPPETVNAYPETLCGDSADSQGYCLRTAPPREHGGNMDIRYMAKGVTVYLPCFVDGCGLGLGDAHYAQGDGEVSGTAIEMDATITLSTQVVKAGEGPRGIYYEGPASLMNIPSRTFFATTGMPFKQAGEVPPDMDYLESDKIAPLTNLSKDVALAARNALLAMLDYLVQEKGFTREQAYIIMSVAVDVRIGQLVDAPNVNVSAILPLDIFIK